MAYAERMDTESTLWQRSRHAAYAEITNVAMGLFLEQGFEQTTIDQITSTAGISRQSNGPVTSTRSASGRSGPTPRPGVEGISSSCLVSAVRRLNRS